MSLLRDDDDLSVDRFNLEIEAERNPELMRKYSKQLALASAQTKDEKRKLDFLEGEVAEIIRSNKEAYGLIKDSDKVVFAIAKGDPKYQTQFQIYLRAYRREEDLKSAVDTIRQRGMMIKLLAELWLNNYYSTPTVPKHKQKITLKKRRIDFEGDDDATIMEIANKPMGDDVPY